jgi:hypothetical protein
LLARLLQVDNRKDLDALLAEIRRHRKDVDARLASLQGRTEAATDLIERLQKLRERAAKTDEDETLRRKS